MLLLGVLAAQAEGAVAGGTYDLLETEILTGTQASVTFSSLGDYATDYQHLQIRGTMRDSSAVSQRFALRWNGVTLNTYKSHYLFTRGSVVSSDDQLNTGFIWGGVDSPASDAPSGVFNAFVVDILDAFETSKNKTWRIFSGYAAGSGDVPYSVGLHSGFYDDTAATSSLTVVASGAGNLVTGSRFSLYGLRSA